VGAPIGNKNAIGQQDTERPFREALRRAITQDDGKRIRATAEKLLDLAAEGEAWAVKELADRVDGKVAQQITGPGAQGEFITKMLVELVEPSGS
jgi:hypothetical protein